MLCVGIDLKVDVKTKSETDNDDVATVNSHEDGATDKPTATEEKTFTSAGNQDTETASKETGRRGGPSCCRTGGPSPRANPWFNAGNTNTGAAAWPPMFTPDKLHEAAAAFGFTPDKLQAAGLTPEKLQETAAAVGTLLGQVFQPPAEMQQQRRGML